MESNAQLINGLIAYGALVTVAFIVMGALYFKIKDTLTKNKCHYDLRHIKFFLDPTSNDSYHLTFTYGDIVIKSVPITDNDLYLDPKLPFKEFIAWTEEEYAGKSD